MKEDVYIFTINLLQMRPNMSRKYSAFLSYSTPVSLVEKQQAFFFLYLFYFHSILTLLHLGRHAIGLEK